MGVYLQMWLKIKIKRVSSYTSFNIYCSYGARANRNTCSERPLNVGPVHGAPESINFQIMEPQTRDPQDKTGKPILLPLMVIDYPTYDSLRELFQYILPLKYALL